MDLIERLFLAHPREVGETYEEHAGAAARVGGLLAVAALACFVHALAPGLFRSTGSRTVRRLAAELDGRAPLPARRARRGEIEEGAGI